LSGNASIVFMVGSLLLSLVWLWKGYIGFRSNDDAVWARQMFRFSLLVLLGISFLMSIDWLLP
jgi:protoheme IX farnesyltransferase